MKKVIVTIAVVIAVVIAAAAAVLYIRSTPEYALSKIVSDIKENGFDAVENNLTEDAYNKIKPVITIANNDIVSSVVSLFADTDSAGVLIEKAKDVEWSVGDIIKNSNKVSVTIGFDYQDKLAGSIDLELVKTENGWKINDLYNLNIEKIQL